MRSGLLLSLVASAKGISSWRSHGGTYSLDDGADLADAGVAAASTSEAEERAVRRYEEWYQKLHVSCARATKIDIYKGCDLERDENKNPRRRGLPYHNNLGSGGPQWADPEEMRFKSIGRHDGRLLDLVVRALGPYKPHTARANGCRGHFGQLNLRVGDHVKVEFSLRDSESDEAIAPESFHFSVFDFDGGEDPRIVEWIYIDNDAYDACEPESHAHAHGRRACRLARC